MPTEKKTPTEAAGADEVILTDDRVRVILRETRDWDGTWETLRAVEGRLDRCVDHDLRGGLERASPDADGREGVIEIHTPTEPDRSVEGLIRDMRERASPQEIAVELRVTGG